jgi:hypothetical protein
MSESLSTTMGQKVFEVAPGRLGIISHGWADSRYVHVWEI